MKYRRRSDAVVFTLGGLGQEYPNKSFPSDITDADADEFGFDLVDPPDSPVYDGATHYLTGPTVQLVASRWKEVYAVVAFTAQEIADIAAAVAAALVVSRDAVVAQLDMTEDIQRAFMLVMLDELNSHATLMNSILTAIDGAANLAGLKTAIAAIANHPTRTAAQLKNAVLGKLGT